MTTVKGVVKIGTLRYKVESAVVLPGAPTAPPTDPSPPGDRFPFAKGLVDRQNSPKAPAVKVSVIDNNWDLLEPSPGHYDFTVVRNDRAKAVSRGITASILRPQGGLAAPGWLMDAAGTVTVSDPQGIRPSFTTARVWNPYYRERARLLDLALAAEFDDDPHFRGITYWWAGTEFAEEPCIRQLGDATNRAAYAKAGLKSDVDFAQQLDDLHWLAHDSGWRRTPLQVFTSMPHQRLTSTGGVFQDKAFTTLFVSTLRALIPDSVLGVNNADQNSYPVHGHAGGWVYSLLAPYGGPRADQTVTYKKLGPDPVQALRDTINDFIAVRGRTLELPSGYVAMPASELAAFNARIVAA